MPTKAPGLISRGLLTSSAIASTLPAPAESQRAYHAACGLLLGDAEGLRRRRAGRPSMHRGPLMTPKHIGDLLDRMGCLKHACDLDLLLFFHRHPRAFLFSERLAAYVGHELPQVTQSLGTLITAGLLQRSRDSTRPEQLYVLTRRSPLAGGSRRSCESQQHETAGWLSSTLSNSGQPPATPGSRDSKLILGPRCVIPCSGRSEQRPATHPDIGRALPCSSLAPAHVLDDRCGVHSYGAYEFSSIQDAASMTAGTSWCLSGCLRALFGKTRTLKRGFKSLR